MEAFARASTARLRLSRPVESDLAVVHAIHADPVTDRYNPGRPVTDLAASQGLLEEWLEHWARHGFGYWTVRALDDDAVLGFAGLRHGRWLDEPVLNLYYRFGPSSWGRGYATEAARHAVSLAARHFPGVPVLARTTPDNVPSQRTARAAGLTHHGDLDRDDGAGPVVILVSHWPSRP